jgi:uncharacterized protein
MQDKNLLTLELSITDQCNMRCTYCFEQEYEYKDKMGMDQAVLLADRIVALTKEEKFKKIYNGLNITFWGGEPTINRQVLEYFYYRFREEVDVVEFFLYTNGLTILKYLDIIRNGDIEFQISYDGQPLHDLTRKTVGGGSTGKQLIEVFKVLAQEKIQFGIKSTITPIHFKYLMQVYLDFKYLNETIFEPNGMFMQYSPTIDYHGDMGQMNLEAFKWQMKEIAKLEIEHIKNGGKNFVWAWFSSKKGGVCSAGQTMFAIDKEGSYFNCHGALYEDAPELNEGSIFKDNFLDFIEDRKKNSIYEVNEKCKTCASTICSQCNIVFFTKSKKENYKDRWNDLEAHGLPLCNFYDEISKWKTVITSVLTQMGKKPVEIPGVV